VAIDALVKEYETLNFNDLIRGEETELEKFLEKGTLRWKELAKALGYNDQLIVFFEHSASEWPGATPLSEMIRFWRKMGTPLVSSLDKAVTEAEVYTFKQHLASWLTSYWNPKQRPTFVSTEERSHPYQRADSTSGEKRRIKPMKQAVSLKDLNTFATKKRDISKHICTPVVETRFSAVISDYDAVDELANALEADIEEEGNLKASHLAVITGVEAESVDELIEEWKESPICTVNTIISLLGTYRCEKALFYLLQRSNRHKQIVGILLETATD
jgi:hypothetical protein